MSISSKKVAEPGHVLGIDSLRALAVWVVIVYHLNASFLPGGFVGVDIFFAISGFVITKSLLERAPKSVFSFFTGFYRRRFVRIAPALFAYLIIFSALASYFIPKAFLSGGIYETARWAVIGASNIQLVQSSDGYFGERMDYNPFIQTWSLGVEEQFYLFYPLIIAFLVFAILRSRKALERLSVLALVLVTVLSLGVSFWQTNNDGLSAFYLLPARFWELALGGLLYILITRFNRFTNLGPRARSLVFAFGLGLVTLSLVFANVNEFPYWWAIPPVIGALLLIHSSNTVGDSNSKVFKLLTAKPIVYFGKISYSLYLWHWGVFVLMRWTLGLSIWWHYLVALALTVGLAAASYKFVETPFRTGTFIRKMPDWRVIVAGSLVALVSVVAVDFSKSEMTRRAIAVTDPQFKDSKAIADKLATIPKSDIGVGHSIVFVGDSHAGHYKYMGQWIFKKTGAKFSRIINFGCAYVNLQGFATNGIARCPTDEEITASIVAKTKPGDIIVLSSFTTPRIATLDAPSDRKEIIETLLSDSRQQGRAKALVDGISVVKSLQAKGLRVIIAAPTPVFVSPTDRCIRWFNNMNPICANGFREPIEFQKALRAPIMESYKELANKTGATLWDPFPLLCSDGKYCYSEKDGRYLFVDQHHLSSNGNLLLVGSFLETLETIWK